MSPAQLVQRLARGIWLPGDGPQMRLCFSRPAGNWLRVYASMSRPAAVQHYGYSTD